jgi:hypothetical protein
MAFVLFTMYSTAALGQLFFFHVLLIRKVRVLPNPCLYDQCAELRNMLLFLVT